VTYGSILSVVPEPLKMASLPVACMAATIAEGAANMMYQSHAENNPEGIDAPVPSTETSWSLRFASIF